ncbi:solute carrier family 35 member C2-like [Mizuhopecten yessoensis]|uniref:Solute carrier family 35 member C2 n=1 Tax=Mizuhopecten yessoensis TaxID=6573 RepID=A0A210PN81_MIZYE|nr:solute carrier family 35 member C2-like [Mizuhopecten yessoensis]OWF37965.1 Solute carrier family 35 member C2 [Mizuhopecten yessoensis]
MGKKKKHADLERLRGMVTPTASAVKKSVCSVGFIAAAIKILALVVFYYIFSIGLTFYNKAFIHHFQIPLSFTLSHLIIKYMLAGLIRCIVECRTKKERINLPWRPFLLKLAPTGIASSIDIGLSNWSFEFITVSLYTMTKSTAVIFILGFSILFRIEKARWSLSVVVLLVSTGLFMFTYHSTQFHLEGFIMVLSASVLSGLRWGLAQLILQKEEIGLSNPLDMMYHIQPWMILVLLPLAAIFEGVPLASTSDFFRFQDYTLVCRNLAMVFGGACLAFMLEFSEFLLVGQTSCLTFSISGIFKELCTLYLATKINGDEMNPINVIGLLVCLSGITLHVLLKALHKDDAKKASLNREEMMEMIGNEGHDSDEEEEVFNASRDR